MPSSTESLFSPNMLDFDDFMRRYKKLLEQKNSWPYVEIPYYQNRNHIAGDLRYFRFAFEFIITNNVHPNQAVKRFVLEESTSNLNYEEYNWSMLYITGAASLAATKHAEYEYGRDD